MNEKGRGFAHLHCHSSYSMLDGASTPAELCARAAALGMGALAITDTHGLYGAIPFIKIAKEAGIKPILGAELRIRDGPDGAGAKEESKEGPTQRAVILAMDDKGYGALCRAVTAYGMENPFFLRRQILKDGSGIALITESTALLDAIARERGTDGLYLELCAWSAWRRLIPFMKRSGMRPVATNGVHFAGPGDHRLHRLLSAIRFNTTLTALPEWAAAREGAYLKSGEEMAFELRDVPEAIESAAELAEMAGAAIELGRLRLPRFKGWAGKPFGGDEVLVLRQACEEGARRRYGAITEKVRERLDHELSVLEEMGYAGYFLVVADIARFAREEGIPTCGRGSAASSIVSYALGLTHVDPIKHGLFFERFLNRGRSDAPDIDLDFSWKERDRVLEYVYRLHGDDHVAMISTLATLGPRGSVREVAKVMGLPVSEINSVTRRITWTGPPIWKGLSFLGEPVWKHALSLASRIEDYPRHLGIHCGGIIISPGPITSIVPLEIAAKGIAITQWDMYPVEEAGLVKIDLLGNRSLAVIKDARAAIEEGRGARINWEGRDPASDQKTKALMRDGDTMGCFYIESPAMRGLLKKLCCSKFDVLVAASSIIRPGISSSGMMKTYIERYHGSPFTYLHPKMEELLSETFGVMVYQEDVMKVASEIAGMSLAEADGLRKSMSKKRNYERINRFKEKFVTGAIERGVSPEIAKELWRQIESFAGYSFCKAHSASFAVVSFEAAYLRAHYPAELMAAVLSNFGGYYSTFAYIAECWRMGLEVLLPDVNESEVAYTGKGKKVRIGLIQVKGLAEKEMEAIVEERKKNGRYPSIEDFLERVPVEPASVDSLIRAGAMDSLAGGESRPSLMWRHLLWQSRRRLTSAGSSPGLPLASPSYRPTLPKPKPYDKKTEIIFEDKTLGFPVSAHPLELFKERIAGRRLTQGSDIGKNVGKKISLLGWMVTSKPIHTIKGEPMEFVSFEDTTAIYEAIFFPGIYKRFGHLLLTHGPFIVTGKVEEDFGHATLTVEKIELLARESWESSPTASRRRGIR